MKIKFLGILKCMALVDQYLCRLDDLINDKPKLQSLTYYYFTSKVDNEVKSWAYPILPDSTEIINKKGLINLF